MSVTKWHVLELAVILTVSVLLAALLRWLWPFAPWYAWLLVWLYATKWVLVVVFDTLNARGAA